MAEKLTVALIQTDMRWEDRNANFDHFQSLLEGASDEVDLLILPEMFTTGFSMNAADLAEPLCGPTFEWMSRMAARKDAAVTGSVITAEGDHFYNRLYFVYPDGNFRTYDKRHTFTFAGEHQTYSRGKERLVVEWKGWRICPMICYDLRFPVWSRNTDNYDFLLYVANWPATRISAWDILLRARAIENMSYCAGVNRVGRDGKDLDYVGHSAVYNCLGDPLSNDLPEAACVREEVLEKNHLVELRNQLRFLEDADPFTLQEITD